jgi:hypothetical protein
MGNAAERNHHAGRNLVRDGTRGRGTAAICYFFGTETVMLRYFRLPV